ncbi:DUF5675 family protein [Helicobacter sp. 13S00477-4]|uniref:DUF5675 family protein n=1 Tax=Helicobacter sp. 13S00477-4 TaxID=1905759 RepID=UPI000BC4A976|nr:DUF5675 family protein [Helicobacter sp. 13S00477-4]PAF52016.1 hypothetical protein BKH44_04900 [Helicobacter sp. 13S00477-4]
MNLLLTRFKEAKDSTLSKLKLIDNDKILFECYGLEPLNEGIERDKGYRIPEGKYGLIWHHSQRFKLKLPLLHNIDVPIDRDILIHAGNYPKDTIGCILVGDSYKQNNESFSVLNSKKTLYELLNHLPEKISDVILKVENNVL